MKKQSEQNENVLNYQNQPVSDSLRDNSTVGQVDNPDFIRSRDKLLMECPPNLRQ